MSSTSFPRRYDILLMKCIFLALWQSSYLLSASTSYEGFTPVHGYFFKPTSHDCRKRHTWYQRFPIPEHLYTLTTVPASNHPRTVRREHQWRACLASTRPGARRQPHRIAHLHPATCRLNSSERQALLDTQLNCADCRVSEGQAMALLAHTKILQP